MKKILFILLFGAGLILTSCSKTNPIPETTCQDGGEEVTP